MSDRPATPERDYGWPKGDDAVIANAWREPVRRIPAEQRRPTAVTLTALWLGFEAFKSALGLLEAIRSVPAMQAADRGLRDALELAGSADSSGTFTDVMKWYLGPTPPLTNGAIMLAGILFAVMLFEGALAYGIWTMSESARKLAVGWFAVSALFILAGLALAESVPSEWQVLSAFIAVIGFVYLRRPEVRAAFRARWLPLRRR